MDTRSRGPTADPRATAHDTRGTAARSPALVGALLVMGGAMLFACKGLFAKALYAEGVRFEVVVLIRALLSLPLFWGFALARDGAASIRGTRPRALLAAAIAGIACYAMGALTDFYALTLIDASVERVLLFSYPAMVVAANAFAVRRLPSRRVLAATLATYLGIFLVMGGFDPRVLVANAVGACWVLFAALTYAAYFMIGARYTREIGASRFTLFGMSAATVAIVLWVLVRGGPLGLARITPTGWLLLAAISTLCMFVPALMQAEGMRRVGAERGSVLSTAGPPTTLFLAWLILGERLIVWQLGGIALIVGGILVLDLSKGAPKPVEDS